MSDTENNTELIKKTKLRRRNGKAALTRLGRTISVMISGNRSAEEVQKALDVYIQTFSDLTSKHEELTLLIEDDTQFEDEEKWLLDVQETFMRLKIDTQDYIQEKMSEKMRKNDDQGNQGSGTEPEVSHTEITNATETTTNLDESSQNTPTTSESPTPQPEATPTAPENTGTPNTNSNQSNYQMEKPKLPRFTGDVRDYAIFKADFKHIVEARYGKRDAITILRSSLQGKPLDMIKGIGHDYDAAWDYLDSVYGDPRFVADIITQDISRFKPIKESEDSRFCDLVHLVRRSFNTLKEVGHGQQPYACTN
jgi:hypothetical protein